LLASTQLARDCHTLGPWILKACFSGEAAWKETESIILAALENLLSSGGKEAKYLKQQTV
jgi:hypothetical protein